MRRKGFTLVEALVVMMIMALIGGAIMAFYPASAKLFQRGGARSQAESACSQAIKEMAPVVREAMYLSGEVRLEVSLPTKQTEAMTGEELVVYPLTVGKEVAFYRSDSSGSPTTTGDNFWRAEKIAGEWKPSELLAKGVTSFTFTVERVRYVQDGKQMVLDVGVEVLVSSRATLGSRQVQVTHGEYLMCRNSQPREEAP